MFILEETVACVGTDLLIIPDNDTLYPYSRNLLRYSVTANCPFSIGPPSSPIGFTPTLLHNVFGVYSVVRPVFYWHIEIAEVAKQVLRGFAPSNHVIADTGNPNPPGPSSLKVVGIDGASISDNGVISFSVRIEISTGGARCLALFFGAPV